MRRRQSDLKRISTVDYFDDFKLDGWGWDATCAKKDPQLTLFGE